MVDGLSPYAGEQVRFAAAFSASDQNLPVAKARVIFGYFLHPFGRAIIREPHSKPVNIEPAQLNRIGSSHCANRTPNPEVQLRKSIRSRFKPAFQMGRKKIGGGRCDQVLRAFKDEDQRQLLVANFNLRPQPRVAATTGPFERETFLYFPAIGILELKGDALVGHVVHADRAIGHARNGLVGPCDLKELGTSAEIQLLLA